MALYSDCKSQLGPAGTRFKYETGRSENLSAMRGITGNAIHASLIHRCLHDFIHQQSSTITESDETLVKPPDHFFREELSIRELS